MVAIGKKEAVFFSVFAAALAADQATKLLARNMQKPISVIDGFLSISPARNTGAAFGLLTGASTLLALFGIAVAAAIIIYYKKIPDVAYTKTGVALILAGTTGNIIDRLLLGYVTDFISFSFWPAFNIADSALTIGTGLMILHFARNR
ncbi:signal peptidase II [Candidatus Woesearchaeota archaeon]|nr:signal peptidase II [Candidatus Woesearchaeota archaeon]